MFCSFAFEEKWYHSSSFDFLGLPLIPSSLVDGIESRVFLSLVELVFIGRIRDFIHHLILDKI